MWQTDRHDSSDVTDRQTDMIAVMRQTDRHDSSDVTDRQTDVYIVKTH